MSWFSNLIKGAVAKQTIDWTFVDDLADPGLGIAGQHMAPDECYVEIYLESLRLKQARRFATAFHGAVYSFFSLSQEGAEDAQFAAVSKPARLANLDSQNLDRVITLSLQMMGAVPWRGGVLGIELGLFSVKQDNLLTPLLDYVARVSEQGGISFLGQVKPFVPLITQGMDLIAGQTKDAAIEVAIDTDMKLEKSRFCAIIAAPKDKYAKSALRIDGDRKLLVNNEPLEEAYCVFSIRKSDRKADFGAIPEIKTAFASLKAGLASSEETQAQSALASFRRTVLLNSDLITADKQRLISKASDLHRSLYAKGPVSVSRHETMLSIEKSELADLNIYDGEKAAGSQAYVPRGPAR